MSKETSQAEAPSHEFADELPIGSSLMRGQYTIEKFINAGGFGITYRAKDSLDRMVVIKECFPGNFCRRSSRAFVNARSRAHQKELDSIVRLFVQEARSLAKLAHPNIVGVYQVFEENNTAYMVLDYVQGCDLLDVIEENAMTLAPDEVESILRKVLDAVAFIHNAEILHRDISPDNILLDDQKNPILIDFGAAREQASKQSRVLSALRVVKDGYSPQEFYIQGSEQGPYSDLYALGATFYHVITGELPPSSQVRLAKVAGGEPDPYVPTAGRIEGYSQHFLEALDKSMSILPRDRIATAGEWLERMYGVKTDAPKPKEEPKKAETAEASGTKRVLMATAAVGAIGVGAALQFLPSSVTEDGLAALAGVNQAVMPSETPAPTPEPVVEAAPNVADLPVPLPVPMPEPDVADAPVPAEAAPAVVADELPTEEVLPPEDAEAAVPEARIAPVPFREIPKADFLVAAPIQPVQQAVAITTAPEPVQILEPSPVETPVAEQDVAEEVKPVPVVYQVPQAPQTAIAPLKVAAIALDPTINFSKGWQVASLEAEVPARVIAPTFDLKFDTASATALALPVSLPVVEEIVVAEPEPDPVAHAAELTPAAVLAPSEVLGFDVGGMLSRWTVEMPLGFFFAGEEGAQGIVAVNGKPVANRSEFDHIINTSVPPSADGTVTVDVSIAGPAGVGETVETWTLPVVQNTLILSGVAFETRWNGETWVTLVSKVPADLNIDLRPGDIVVGHIPTNQRIDTRLSLPTIVAEVSESGLPGLAVAVRRGAETWAVVLPISSS